ncbi:MAG: putative toxin-antitoxin system toxin component, PIN family [Blastocatellia bacterium AA13]|nr:MAG: putative toxin-antitoxin system toxin component, PIN family [Blastocatellia bacterium AA13]
MVCLQAAARDQSPAAACLRLAENRYIRLFISRDILREVQNVLSRGYVRARFQTLTDETVTAFLERLRNASEFIRAVPRPFTYEERDVKDEPYINLAVEVEAHYVLSRDKDLLDLMNWETEAGREFQKRFRFLRIVPPEVFLGEIAKRDVPD